MVENLRLIFTSERNVINRGRAHPSGGRHRRRAAAGKQLWVAGPIWNCHRQGVGGGDLHVVLVVQLEHEAEL